MDEARGRPVAYIASAYSGNIEKNTIRTREYSRYAIDRGFAPLNPILNLTGVLFDETDRELAMAIDLDLLQRAADELWVFGRPTAGMRMEIAEAEKCGMKIRFFTEAMEETL